MEKSFISKFVKNFSKLFKFLFEIISEQIINSKTLKLLSIHSLILLIPSTMNELDFFLLRLLVESLEIFLKSGLLLLDIYFKIFNIDYLI